MTVAIIDHGSGNLRSAAKAFERQAAELGTGEAILVTGDPDAVVKADRIVLPGVGAFGDCRRGVDRLDGMLEALTEAVVRQGKPFLGICVGMQLMADAGLEHGRHPGFGWIPGEVREITPVSRPGDPALKVPHMGWNALTVGTPHPVLDGIATGTDVYFVHSYHLVATDSGTVLATTEHGGAITAAVGRDNMIGTQFHPEKSQAAGLRLIGNFLRWRP